MEIHSFVYILCLQEVKLKLVFYKSSSGNSKVTTTILEHMFKVTQW